MRLSVKLNELYLDHASCVSDVSTGSSFKIHDSDRTCFNRFPNLIHK